MQSAPIDASENKHPMPRPRNCGHSIDATMSSQTGCAGGLRARGRCAKEHPVTPEKQKTLGRLTKGVGPTIGVLGHVARGAPTQNPPIRRLGGQASGCCCFFGDHFGHSSVACKGQALAWSDVASSGGRLDSPPGTMCWKANNGIANMSASAAALAGDVRVGRGADRDASPGRCVAW